MNEKLDKVRSLEIFGLEDNATEEEIERRYDLLLKKNRSMELKQQRDPAFVPDEHMVTLDELNEAYRVIKGIEKEALAPLKMGWNKEWFAHFFHYYKIHVLLAIVLLVVIGFSIKGAADRQAIRDAEALLPKPNLEVIFVGNYGSDDIPTIEKSFLSQFPEWERIKVEIIYRPLKLEGQMDPAYMQKSMIELMTKKGDVYIMDKVNYDQLMEQEFFVDPAEIGVKSGDLTNSPLWSSIPMIGTNEKIAAISRESAKKENAKVFIEKLQLIK